MGVKRVIKISKITFRPKACRGLVSMTTGLFVQIGLVAGSVVALPRIFGTFDLWWIIYLIEFSILVVVLALISFIHESPGQEDCKM